MTLVRRIDAVTRFIDGLVWGSPDGPAIVIDWEARTVQLKRMPTRTMVRLARWVYNGQKEMSEGGDRVCGTGYADAGNPTRTAAAHAPTAATAAEPKAGDQE